MKRPDTIAIFSPVKSSPEAVASSLLGLALDELKGSLGRYFVKLRYDPEVGSYEPVEEFMDLGGRDDLLKRVKDQKNCMWRFHASMGFASNFVYPAIFLDPEGGPGLTVLLVIDPAITRFIEKAEETRVPFAVFLARFAKAVEAKWFLSGLFLDTWRPLPAAKIPGRDQLGPMPYFVGWEGDAFKDEDVAGKLGLRVADVKRTTLGYHFLSFF